MPELALILPLSHPVEPDVPSAARWGNNSGEAPGISPAQLPPC
jgi:hypothetical protein